MFAKIRVRVLRSYDPILSAIERDGKFPETYVDYLNRVEWMRRDIYNNWATRDPGKKRLQRVRRAFCSDALSHEYETRKDRIYDSNTRAIQ